MHKKHNVFLDHGDYLRPYCYVNNDHDWKEFLTTVQDQQFDIEDLRL